MKANKNIFPETNNENFEEIAPKLSAIGNSNPFETPQKYFDDLPILIEAKITETKETSLFDKIIQYIVVPKHAISFAVTLLVILTAIFVFKSEFPSIKSKSQFIAIIDTNISIEKKLQNRLAQNDSNGSIENRINYIPKPETLEKIEENLSTVPDTDILEYLYNESEYDTNSDLLTDL
jgi:hypothetical protein